MTEQTDTGALAIDYAQLSQIRVPLAQAGDVFSQKDARGRTPVVLVPLNPNRIQNAFVIAGLVVWVGGFIVASLLNQWMAPGTSGANPSTSWADPSMSWADPSMSWAWPTLGSVLGVALIVFGVYRSFLVRIPEGTTALLTRAGRHARTLEAGPQFVPPWFAVSHLVTQREIPYDVPAIEALTGDNVRATVDTLITFTITDPYRFVYSITADDFDAILLAACLDALRGAVRRLPAEKVADLTRQETGALKDALNAEIEPYGVNIKKINVTDARPPEEFQRSQEGRQLAVFLRAEQDEKQALAQRLQAGAEALARQQTVAQVERERESLQIQVQQAEIRKRIARLEAEAQDLRLSTLEQRLRNYPQAAAYEAQGLQLDVARALAGNSRAVLQIGAADDILRAYVLRQFLQYDGAGEGAGVLVSQAPELAAAQESDGRE